MLLITTSWSAFGSLNGHECFTPIVHGYVGQNVTLPCRYNAHYHGALHMCWGRGYVPYRGCNNKIISTDGNRVTMRKSYRYQLLGRLTMGEVSLTILNTIESDAGIYGCRIQIPGWLNDQKDTVQLILKKAPVKTPVPVTTAQVTTSNPTHGPVMTTEPPVSSPWPTDPETTDTLATDALTQSAIYSHTRKRIPVTTDQETPNNSTQAKTTELPMLSSWPTDPEATDTLTTDAVTQGGWSYSTASPTLVPQNNTKNEIEVWISENFTSAEKTLMHSPHLVWILCLTLLLVILMGTAFVFRMRKQQKADRFKLSQETGSTIALETSDPSLELETIKVVM